MRKYFLLLFAFCLLNGLVSAQYYWKEMGTGSHALNTGGNPISGVVTDTNGSIYVGVGGNDGMTLDNVWNWNGTAWRKLGALNADQISSMCTDKNGNIYVAADPGDPGTVAEWKGSSWPVLGNLDAYATIGPLCTDAAGNLYTAWGFSIDSNYNFTSGFVSKWDGNSWTSLGIGAGALNANNYVEALCADAHGNIYATGDFIDSNDYAYVAKWDGNTWSALPWQSSFRPEQSDPYDATFYGINGMCIDPAGNVYALGTFYDSSFTVGVAKFDGNKWSSVGPLNDPFHFVGNVLTICSDDSGNIYVAGTFKDSSGYCYVAKWNGNYWSELGAGNYSLKANNRISNICANRQGNIFATGNFNDASGHNYIAVYGLLPPGDIYTYLSATDANCSANGEVTSIVFGGTPPYAYLWSNGATTGNITSLSGGNYAVTVTDSLGRLAMGYAIVENTCNSVVAGTVFNDVNGNCIIDSNDRLLQGYNVEVLLSNGNTHYANTDANGQYFLAFPDSGICLIYPSNSAYCGEASICGQKSDTLVIPYLGDTLKNINIAITSAAFDLTIHPGWYPANPGFTKEYWVMPYNISPYTITGNVTVIFTYDPNLIYQSSLAPLPAVDTIAHTLTWVVSGSSIPSPYFDWNNERFISYFLVPSSLSLNYQLQSDFVIEPYIGDCDTSNNHLHFSQAVTGSHDPNSKEVTPPGNVTDKDSVLTYTINYQNTGTDSTNFIIVKDTLSPNLLPGSVVNLASSDKYSAFNISGTGILTWIFNPLRIPPLSTDSIASKGFIIYSVKKKHGLPLGSTISNSATIYFDYNTGVRTNTVTDTATVSIATGLSDLKTANEITVQAAPNPFNDLTHITVNGIRQKFDFELFDVTGKLQLRIPSLTSNQFNVSRDRLADGVYLYRIVAGGQPVGYGRLVIQ